MYIVWDLIDEYSGHSQTYCDTWEDVCNHVRSIVDEHQYRRWESGKTPYIQRHNKKGDHLLQEVFVTSGHLTEPL